MPLVRSPVRTPSSLRAEHEELHRELAAAVQLPDRLGEAARAVADSLHPHFLKEEDCALRLLGALPELAAGRIPADIEEIHTLSQQLESELEPMVREHRVIVAALNRFEEIAQEAGRTDLVQFVTKLKRHAASEEEVLYPAAVLVGKYLNHVKPTFKQATRPVAREQELEC